MAILYKNLKFKTLSLGPLILLYFLSVTEIDTQFSNYFEILSFNLQLIIVYYWVMKDPSILGNGEKKLLDTEKPAREKLRKVVK